MNTTLPQYVFESHSVRVVLDENGIPWWVAKDVVEALEYKGWQPNLIAHVPGRWKGVKAINTPGGVQQMATLSEEGVYFFLARSDKPKALPMQEWIAGEVLPAIRAVGGYNLPGASAAQGPGFSNLTPEAAATQAKVVVLGMAYDMMVRVPGVKPGIAMAHALAAIEQNTGVRTEELRKALPAAEGPLASLNPTQLGAKLAMSAQKVNQALAAMGLQQRNARGKWELTEAGGKYGEMLPFTKNGHSDYQPLWRPEVTEQILGHLKGQEVA